LLNAKRILKPFSWVLFISFLLSCHSNNNVVSSFGKRKYRKGYFWNPKKNVDTKASPGKDSTLRHVYPPITKTGKKDSINTKPEVKPSRHEIRLLRRLKKDSIRRIAKANKTPIPSKDETDTNKIKAPPEPPDDFTLKLIIMIVVLTAFFTFVTGLITPILIWGITQNFLLIAGVTFILLALFLSINRQLGINLHRTGADKQYNIGKPALSLSLWATIALAFLYFTVKTSLLTNLLITQIATIGLFVAGACIGLSLVLAIKALFVNDRHPGKAWLAILIDALLITAIVLLF
jgi:hypothetical protein